MTYHLCAEDMTKTVFVPNLREDDRLALDGRYPSSGGISKAILCDVSCEEGFSKTPSMLLVLQLVSHWMQLSNSLKSLVVPCAWTHSPKSVSLRDAVRDVTHHDDRTTTNSRDQQRHISLKAPMHFPKQPLRSPVPL